MSYAESPEPVRSRGTRERIVVAASELFYQQGIRDVPVEAIIERADVTRSTFYRYFRAKDDLVIAYIDAEDQRIRQQFAEASLAVSDPTALLPLVFAAITQEICQANFRGCSFINAAVEYPAVDHPVKLAVVAHRAWFFESIRQLLRRCGHPEAENSARALVALRDGAMMGGALDHREAVVAGLAWAAERLVAESVGNRQNMAQSGL